MKKITPLHFMTINGGSEASVWLKLTKWQKENPGAEVISAGLDKQVSLAVLYREAPLGPQPEPVPEVELYDRNFWDVSLEECKRRLAEWEQRHPEIIVTDTAHRQVHLNYLLTATYIVIAE